MAIQIFGLWLPLFFWGLLLLLLSSSFSVVVRAALPVGGPPLYQVCPLAQAAASPTRGNPTPIVGNLTQRNFRHLLWHCSAQHEQQRRTPQRDDYMSLYRIRGTGDVFRLQFLWRNDRDVRPYLIVYRGATYSGCHRNDEEEYEEGGGHANNIFDHASISEESSIQDDGFFYNGEYSSPCVTSSELYDKRGISWKTNPDQLYVVLVFANPREDAIQRGCTTFALQAKAYRPLSVPPCGSSTHNNSTSAAYVEHLGNLTVSSNRLALLGNTNYNHGSDDVVYDLPRCNDYGVIEGSNHDLRSSKVLRTFRVMPSNAIVTVRVKGSAGVVLYYNRQEEGNTTAFKAEHPTSDCAWKCAAVTSKVYYDSSSSASLRSEWSSSFHLEDDFVKVYNRRSGTPYLLVVDSWGPFALEVVATPQDNVCANAIHLDGDDPRPWREEGTLSNQSTYNLTSDGSPREATSSFPFQLFTVAGGADYYTLLHVESPNARVHLNALEFVADGDDDDCSPYYMAFYCSRQQDAILLAPTTTPGQAVHRIGLMGHSLPQTTTTMTSSATNNAATADSAPTYSLKRYQYPIGNLYNDTTDLGIVGSRERLFFEEEVDLERDAFVYQVPNSYACTSRGIGPGRVYTMTIAQPRSGFVYASTSSPQQLRVDLFQDSVSCNDLLRHHVEAGERLSVFVFAPVFQHTAAPIVLTGALRIRFEADDPLCNSWEHIPLGEITTSGRQVRGTTAAEDQDPTIYSFTVSDAVERMRLRVQGYRGRYMSAVLYEPTEERCENQVFESKFDHTSTWLPNPSTTYLLMVSPQHPSDDYDLPKASDFELHLHSLGYMDPCVDVGELVLSSHKGVVVQNSTSDASLNSMPFCGGSGSSADARSPTRLYSFDAPSNGLVKAILSDSRSSYGIRLSVYTGKCTAISCVENMEGQGSARSFWDVKENVRYHVAVHGWEEDSHTSKFDLLIDYMETLNLCSDAEVLDLLVNETLLVTGSTRDTTYSASVQPCSGSYKSGKAYSIRAKASGVLVGSVSGLRERMSFEVYTGDCNEPVCHSPIAGSSYWRQSKVWSLEAGREYHIVVWADDAGDFELRLEILPLSTVCDDAIDLGVFAGEPTHAVGNYTHAGYFADLADCRRSRYETMRGNAVVYKLIVRDDGELKASVKRNDFPSLDVSVAVFRGPCSSPVCMNDSMDFGETSQIFGATSRETVFIVVFGTSPGRLGGFGLDISLSLQQNPCLWPQVEDFGLLSPSGLQAYPYVSPLRDGHSSFNDQPICAGAVSTVLKVVSVVVPTSGNITLEVESFDIDPRIAVFRSSCYEEIQCSAYENWRNASLEVSANEVLFIAVFDCCNDTVSGRFFLEIEYDTPQSTLCESVAELPSIVGERLAIAGTADQFSFIVPLGECTYFDEDQQVSRWAAFSFLGSGDIVTVSAYNPFLDDAEVGRTPRQRVRVLQQECESFLCVQEEGLSASESVWRTIAGMQYFVLVAEEAVGGRDFVLSIDGRGKLPRTLCKDAIHLGIVSPGDIFEEPPMEATAHELTEDHDPWNVAVSFVVNASQTMRVSVTSDVTASLYEVACEGEPNGVGQQTYSFTQNTIAWEWGAQQGVTYHLLISSYHKPENPVRVLKFESAEAAGLCEAAIELTPLSTAELHVNGSTKDAQPFEKGLVCAEYEEASPSVAYMIKGNGEELSLLVNETSPTAAFKMAVFKGTSCDSLERLTLERLYANYYADLTVWSEPAHFYFVAISACQGSDVAVNYALTIRGHPTSDLCQNAVMLDSLEANVSGNSTGAVPFYDFHKCTQTRRDPTVVYEILGDGQTYLARLLNFVDSSASLYLSYGDNCTVTTCLEANGVELSWATQEGKTYFLAVAGENPAAEGGFSISIDLMPLLSDCGPDTIESFPEEEMALKGSFAFGTIARGVFPGCDWDTNRIEATTPVIAFRFLGTGSYYHVRFATFDSGNSPVVDIYAGECGKLVCFPKWSWPSQNSFIFQPTLDEIFTLVVRERWHVKEARGNFTMLLSPLIEGGVVSDAINVTLVPGEKKDIRGSTSTGKFYFDQVPPCYDYSRTTRTIFYRFQGIAVDGITVVASPFAIGSKYMDPPRIAVYQSQGLTADLTCIGDWRDGKVAFQLQPGEVYYMAVFASLYDSSTMQAVKDYAITLSATSAQDSCESLVDLGMIGNSFASFACSSSIGQLGQSPLLSCNGEDKQPYDGIPLILHKIQGNGESLTVSLYTRQVGFPSVSVSLFSGCSKNQCAYMYSQTASWDSNEGVDYIVAVTHGGIGDYILHVSGSDQDPDRLTPSNNSAVSVCSLQTTASYNFTSNDDSPHQNLYDWVIIESAPAPTIVPTPLDGTIVFIANQTSIDSGFDDPARAQELSNELASPADSNDDENGNESIPPKSGLNAGGICRSLWRLVLIFQILGTLKLL